MTPTSQRSEGYRHRPIARRRSFGSLALAVVLAGVFAAAAPARAQAPVARVVASCETSSGTALTRLTTALSGGSGGPITTAGGLAAARVAAVSFARAAQACASRVRHASAATGGERCGRAVAASAFVELARVGVEIQTGIDAALASGSPADATPYFARADAARTQGATRISLVPEILAGRRGCANGQPLARKLGAATLRVLPALAKQADQLARSYQGRLYPEDAETFGLLIFQLDTGRPPPAAAVDAALARIERRVPSTDRWRIPGFRTFWATFTNVDWMRYPLTAAGFAGEFQTYLGWKQTAERNAINQSLAGIVGTEQAWENALGGWKAIEQRWYTTQQASIAEYDAYRTSIDAEKVIQETDAALQNG